MVMDGGEDGRGINYAVRAFQYGYIFGSICVQSGGTFTHLASVQVRVAHSLHTLSFLPLGL